ncbi:MAG: hypothetical protein JSS34_00345 [Proteobacteria bacterium]|nr:hypothetical protein [Pseudomonadota bacterium]
MTYFSSQVKISFHLKNVIKNLTISLCLSAFSTTFSQAQIIKFDYPDLGAAEKLKRLQIRKEQLDQIRENKGIKAIANSGNLSTFFTLIKENVSFNTLTINNKSTKSLKLSLFDQYQPERTKFLGILRPGDFEIYNLDKFTLYNTYVIKGEYKQFSLPRTVFSKHLNFQTSEVEITFQETFFGITLR